MPRQKTIKEKRGQFRRLQVQSLEQRMMLAGDWHNESNPQDVNGDGSVSAVDALRVINTIERYGAGKVTYLQEATGRSSVIAGSFHPDVNGNGTVSAQDALQVINRVGIQHGLPPEAADVVLRVDDQGAATGIVFSVADGRSQTVDFSQSEVTVQWSGVDATVLDKFGNLIVEAKPLARTIEFFNELGESTLVSFANELNESSSGTLSIQLESTDGSYFVEGFELGLRLESLEGEIYYASLWSDFIQSNPDAKIHDYYRSVLTQQVPAGSVVVLATVNIGRGPKPIAPNVFGELRCRLEVDVASGETTQVEIGFDSCPTRLR